MNLIELSGLSFTYALGKAPALKNIDLRIDEGEALVILGKSGSGKSTLLRCVKKEITPAGTITGGRDISLLSHEIAIVFQNPDTQIVNHTVIDELVFYMENLGYEKDVMKKNLAETVGYFGLDTLLHKPVFELSGGQKQLVSLCSALMTRPRLLLLDEPTSQLDPITARGFRDILERIRDDFGVAMIIAEHRPDCVTFAERTAVMADGEIACIGSASDVFRDIYERNEADKIRFIPDIPRLSLAAGMERIFFTPREFKSRVTAPECAPPPYFKNIQYDNVKPILTMRNVFFSYDTSAGFVLKNLSFDLCGGERLCLFGGNGSGKSTFLKLLCRILKPASGFVSKHKNKLAYMPQDIRSFFRYQTVRDELLLSGDGTVNGGIAERFGLVPLLERHPFDLSGGEMQKLVLACMLSSSPDILVMDEPTKGLDPYAKKELSEMLSEIGSAIIISTHDTDFAAGFATRCAMIFDGEISFSSEPHSFFSRNEYYTTGVNLGVRHICPSAITYGEALPIWER